MANAKQAKQIRADIIIGGKADNSLTQVGAAIQTLGNQVNQVSEKLIQFGKESTNAYVDFEDAMLDAQVALSTQYTTTTQLDKVMNQLQSSAYKWAASSRFTTNDVATAISEAAHAGWDLEEILQGIPSAMQVSLAGGMSLSQGLEYLIDITNASGIAFSDLAQMADYWTYAANSSSTTVPEMGEAMQKMGATMQFVKGDMASLTTMLAVLADNGTKGSQAGTLLRNSLIRMIAPTQKAAEAMEGLDITSEELDDIYADPEQIENAAKQLEQLGFSAYDSNGNLKNFLTIFEDLNAATKDMTEQDRNQLLSAIFPTRTITGALALLNAAGEGWGGLYDSILLNGGGYTEYAMKTMESGLGGTLRMMQATYDVLQTKTGEELSDDVKSFATSITDFLNSVNEMDEDMFSAVVKGLEVIAVAGPGLLAAGGAIKLIGMIMGTGPMGWGLLAATGITALAFAIDDFVESTKKERFGDLSGDKEAIGEFLGSISEDFRSGYQAVDQYNLALDEAFNKFSTAGSSLKENLLNYLLTDRELTPQDKENLAELGETLGTELINGINASFSEDEALVLTLFGENAEENTGLLSILNTAFNEATTTAEELSRQLRSALTSAFDDDTLTEDEIKNIQGIIGQMNDLIASQYAEDEYVKRMELLRKAQTMGIDSMDELSELAKTQRDDEWEMRQQQYDRTRFRMARYGATETELAEYDAAVQATENAYKDEFDDYLLNLWTSAIQGSEMGWIWDELANNAALYLAGDMTRSEAHSAFRKSAGNNTYAGEADFLNNNMGTQIGEFLLNQIEAFGGYGALAEKIRRYGSIENPTQADTDIYNRLMRLYAMEEIANNFQLAGGEQMSIDRDKSTSALNLMVGADTTPMEEDLEAFIEGTDIKIPVTLLPDMTSLLPLGLLAAARGTGYADGGRADQPSIFGEAGAEWAIPEQHSARTAALLDAARRASGFSWGELLSRTGGLNAGNGGGTLVYSPTIYANDAAGVDSALKNDKKRMEKWYRDRELMRDVEVYA